MSTPDTFSLYRLSLEREQFVRENEGDKKRIKAIFNMAIPQLFKAMGEWKFSLGANALLREYANPIEVVKLGLNQFKEFIQKYNYGSLDPDLVQRIFDACQSACRLYDKLKDCKQMPFDWEQIRREVRRKIDMIQYRQEQIKQIEKEMKGYYKKVDPQEILRSVKGFGLVISCALIGSLGNINRFSNAKKIVAYCGLAPRKKQSGETDRQGMPLTKAGKRILKKYLYLAGETARQWDPHLANLYFKLRKAGKPHTKAMGAIAAHMATRAYAMLKKVYEPQHEKNEEKNPQKVCYQLRDMNGNSISAQKAREIIKEKYQVPKKAKQTRKEKKIQSNSKKNREDSFSKEKKAAQPDNFCFIPRQSKTPQTGIKGSLEQLITLENIVKVKNCQEQVRDFLVQNQNIFESTNTLLSWLDEGMEEQELREIILANISLYRRKISMIKQL